MSIIKLSQLTALSGVTPDDLVYAIDDPSGTPVSKKITFADVAQSLSELIELPIESITGLEDQLTDLRIDPTIITNSDNTTSGYIFETIPDNQFASTASIGLRIGDSVTSIGSYAFYYCQNLTGSLVIPDSVTTIGERAFEGCYGFDGTLIIGSSITLIDGPVFRGCSGFTALTIGNSVTTIGSQAFRGCIGFTGNLVLPDSLTSIGSYAFYDCYGFTGSLTIGNNVTSIGDQAFNNCSGFTSLTIPNSVTSIGNSAFANCSSIETINILATTAPIISSDAFYSMGAVSPPVIHVPVGATGYAGSYDGLTVVYDL